MTPAPGKPVVLTYRVERGSYESKNDMVVSADGCNMAGTFLAPKVIREKSSINGKVINGLGFRKDGLPGEIVRESGHLSGMI